MDCKHARRVVHPYKTDVICTLYADVDLVTGIPVYDSAVNVRRDEQACGIGGKLFAPIEKKKKKKTRDESNSDTRGRDNEAETETETETENNTEKNTENETEKKDEGKKEEEKQWDSESTRMDESQTDEPEAEECSFRSDMNE